MWWESRGLRGWEGLRDCSGVEGTGGNPGDSLQSPGLRGWEGLQDCSGVEGTGGNPGDSIQSQGFRGWEKLWASRELPSVPTVSGRT